MYTARAFSPHAWEMIDVLVHFRLISRLVWSGPVQVLTRAWS